MIAPAPHRRLPSLALAARSCAYPLALVVAVGCAHLASAAKAVDVAAALRCAGQHPAQMAACLGRDVVSPALRAALDEADAALDAYQASRDSQAEPDGGAAQRRAEAALEALAAELAR
jgi:hypothetical protein